MNKLFKAVSPLIATLLLIAVALVIAGILYTWTSSYFKLQTQEFETATTTQTECAFAGLSIDDSINSVTCCDLNVTDQLDSLSRLTFKLSNTGTKDFNGDFTILASDGNNLVTLAYTPNLGKGAFVLVNCSDSLTESNGCRRTSLLVDFNQLTSLVTLRVTPSDCPNKYDESTSCRTST